MTDDDVPRRQWALMSRDGMWILQRTGGFGVPEATKLVAVFSTPEDAETAAMAFGVSQMCKVVKRQ